MALTFHADARPSAPTPAREAQPSLIPVLKNIGISLAVAAFVIGLWLGPLLVLRAAGTLDPANTAMACADDWIMRFEHAVPMADQTPFACFPAARTP